MAFACQQSLALLELLQEDLHKWHLQNRMFKQLIIGKKLLCELGNSRLHNLLPSITFNQCIMQWSVPNISQRVSPTCTTWVRPLTLNVCLVILSSICYVLSVHKQRDFVVTSWKDHLTDKIVCSNHQFTYLRLLPGSLSQPNKKLFTEVEVNNCGYLQHVPSIKVVTEERNVFFSHTNRWSVSKATN